MKLLIFNTKFKKYDILDVMDEHVNSTMNRIKIDGLRCNQVVNEQDTEEKMKAAGYGRAKYY